ncbi:MAG: M24 family metallopeptidase, partial [Mariprofundaceae bacterium]|nr:M24 family metallopeptidase [Mariprofundaceae bacterium]
MVWAPKVTIKKPEEIAIMREAGRINALALAATRALLRPGIATADLNATAEEVLRKHGATSPFKGYPGPYPYPASITVSINDELVHGIPGKRKLRAGDIVSIDCGTFFEGFVADSAYTAGVGEIDPAAQRLLEVTEQALQEGIRQMRPGRRT